MESEDQKVITFHSHYGALLFKRRYGDGCVLRPVPRSLSSSCGTAAFITGSVSCELFDENTEAVYERDGEGWRKIYG